MLNRNCFHRNVKGLLATALLAFVPLAVAQTGRDHWADRVFDADADNDGRVTLEEAQAEFAEMTEEIFAALDRNKDGIVHRRDFGAVNVDVALIRQSIAKAMESDRNGDGRVAYGEIAVARPGYPKRNFDRLDLDEDGFVSQHDLESLKGIRRVEMTDATDDAAARQTRVARLYRALLEADANTDGRVTFEEAHGRMPNLTHDLFARLDRDGNGVLTKKDRRTSQSPAP